MYKNKKNSNDGFSLVELIVVIVILAILIGVTIGGIYQYVNKARINTDLNNASSIESALSVLIGNDRVGKELQAWTIENQKKYYLIIDIKQNLGDTTSIKNCGGSIDGLPETISAIDTVLEHNIPIPKVADKFTISITEDADGNVTEVSCKAYDTNNKQLNSNK